MAHANRYLTPPQYPTPYPSPHPPPLINRLLDIPHRLAVLRALLVRDALLAHDLALDLREAHAARVGVDVLDLLERHRGHEALALPRDADLAVQLVDLLEREALGLVDHGPHEDDADDAAATPDEEDFGAQVGVAGAVIDEVWRRAGREVLVTGCEAG